MGHADGVGDGLLMEDGRWKMEDVPLGSGTDI